MSWLQKGKLLKEREREIKEKYNIGQFEGQQTYIQYRWPTGNGKNLLTENQVK